MHAEPHPLAGQTVKIRDDAGAEIGGATYRVEDWWDRMYGGSWMTADGNPAAMKYALRIGMNSSYLTPLDDEVVYGKVDGLGHLVHVSELVTPTTS